MAKTLKEAGFSMYTVANVMPDDIVPDVEEELARQKKEREEAFADMEARGLFDDDDEEDNEGAE